MYDTPVGWRERAVGNLMQEAEQNDQLFRATMDRLKRSPKIIVDASGIHRPRKALRSLAQQYRESSDFYRRYAQQLRSGHA